MKKLLINGFQLSRKQKLSFQRDLEHILKFKIVKLEFKYNQTEGHNAKQFKNELANYLEVNEQNILLAFLSFKDVEAYVDDSMLTTDI